MSETDDSGASGKKNSGRARMAKLDAEAKRELGKIGAASRWAFSPRRGDTVYDAAAWGDLPIAGNEIPCAVIVVEGEVIRVVSERELVKSLGGKRGGSHWLRAKGDPALAKLPPVLSASNLQQFISAELREAFETRYPYRLPTGGAVANGVRAELYPMICEVFLRARDTQGGLLPGQEDLAKAADILMRALAHTGIIALVDEATGWQTKRPVDALARILDAFIAKELQPYIPTFQADYYEQLFRLRGLNYTKDSVLRPQYFGWLTNDIVYRRLAPKVLAELKRVRKDEGKPGHKLFQRLTANRGYPKLREHLGAVVAIMKLSNDYNDFLVKLDAQCPRYGQNYLLPFGGTPDDGKGL